jgi:hypothetical protein
MKEHYVCQFSCGAASAVATKIMLDEYPGQVDIVNAYLEEEHKDNRRFAADCETWFGVPITVLRDTKHGASTLEVWRRRRYIKGPRGAPCSLELKRKLLHAHCDPSDIQVIGFTSEETKRLEELRDSFPEVKWKAPLIEKNISKQSCYRILMRAGIDIPVMYELGYDNANCIGCPKGGQGYWQKIRQDFPERFVQISNLQQEIGPGAYFLQFRSGDRKGERMSLLELPLTKEEAAAAEDMKFNCSFYCDTVVERHGS